MSQKEDFLDQLDNIKQTTRKKTKKRINVKSKGNRGENEFCKILETRFPKYSFTRTFGSGQIVGGTNMAKRLGLDEDVISMLSSDIVTPKNFKWSLEHKWYSEDSMTITNLLYNKNDLLEWWLQCKTDAKKANRLPLLVVKTNYRERYVVFNKINIDLLHNNVKYLTYNLHDEKNNETEELVIIALDFILKLPDNFWLNAS